MGKIRKEFNHNFTTVMNAFLRDQNINLVDRGLLMTMLSLPDNWDFSIRGLAAIVPDGKSKIETSLKRLEAAGYLKRERIYKDGKIADWNYIFSDEPAFLEINKQKDIVANATTNLEPDFQELATNKGIELEPNFQDVENLEVENPDANKINNNKINNNINPSITTNSSNEQEKTSTNTDGLTDRQIPNDYLSQVESAIMCKHYSPSTLDVSHIAQLTYLQIPSPTEVYKFLRDVTNEMMHYHSNQPIKNWRKYLNTSIKNNIEDLRLNKSKISTNGSGKKICRPKNAKPIMEHNYDTPLLEKLAREARDRRLKKAMEADDFKLPLHPRHPKSKL